MCTRPASPLTRCAAPRRAPSHAQDWTIIAVGHVAVSTAADFDYQIQLAKAHAKYVRNPADPDAPFLVMVMFELFVDE